MSAENWIFPTCLYAAIAVMSGSGKMKRTHAKPFTLLIWKPFYGYRLKRHDAADDGYL